MKTRTTIDRSLKERHGIVHLLTRVAGEGITADEMEEIGASLQKSGQRALSPLVRRLWHEKNGDVISKYTYLLDFFEDEVWLDQLIQIALRRRDLEEKGKIALLTALEGCGIDVSAAPFANLLPGGVKSLHTTLPRLFDRGDEGLVIFVEDLLFSSSEEQGAIIRELATLDDGRVLPLLELILGIEVPELQGEVIATLGRIRKTAAANLLATLVQREDAVFRDRAAKSLRRLSFAGIRAESPRSPERVLPFHSACASPVDCAGYRILWLCRPLPGGMLVAIYLQVHEAHGIHSVWGSSSLTPEQCTEHAAALNGEEGTEPVAPDYAVQLLKDAVYRSRERNMLLPAEFYIWRRYLADDEVSPLPYEPRFSCHESRRVPELSWLVEAAATLFEDDCFAGWVLANHRVYDFAEEWQELERKYGGSPPSHGMETLVRRFCVELLEPQRVPLQRRLVLTADFMANTGRDAGLVGMALAVAHSLGSPPLLSHCHPFLRRLALESMDMAREALAEGYDLRQQNGESFDGEWE
jgi:hypothetical protein